MADNQPEQQSAPNLAGCYSIHPSLDMYVSLKLCRLARIIFVLFLLGSQVPAASAQMEVVEAFPELPRFADPVDIKYQDGRFYVVEQRGFVLSFEADERATRVDTLLDLRGQVRYETIEDGLLNVALHPNYARNGQFFVSYLADDPHRLVLARFTHSGQEPPQADPTSQEVLLEVPQPGPYHHGGGLNFGPEGYLYVSLGDGACCGDPQGNGPDPTTWLGSLLRLDVNQTTGERLYGIPPDNPFFGNLEGIREEVFAYGLRNPWNFSIDPVTKELWLGDVGEGDQEEIDRIVAGANYGWSAMEGPLCFRPAEACDREGLVEPVWSYAHQPRGAVIGGYVYRGRRFLHLVGKYFYGDFMSGQIWTLAYDGATGAVSNEEIVDTTFRITSFGVDGAGELYVVDRSRGRIYTFSDPSAEGPDDPAARGWLELYGPNPVRGTTQFLFGSEQEEQVRIAVYNALGQEVAVLFDGRVPLNTSQSLLFNTERLPAGVYYCRMQFGPHALVQSVVVW